MVGGMGGRGGKRLEGLFGVLDIALIIQVSSFFSKSSEICGGQAGGGGTLNIVSESESIL